VRELWKAFDAFLAGTDKARQSVEELFVAATAAFGLKDGVLPVLLAAALVHGHSQWRSTRRVHSYLVQMPPCSNGFSRAGQIRTPAVPHCGSAGGSVPAICRHADAE